MAERFTISLEVELASQFDAHIDAKGYINRSEAILDLIRERLANETLKKQRSGRCNDADIENRPPLSILSALQAGAMV